jgi:hypothetical protein
LLYAIDFTTLPGMNQAFLFSLFLSIAMTLVAIPYGKRRPKGSPLSWGEAMLSSVYVFGTMFVAYGIVPDRWLQHANTDLKWSKQKLLNGPFDILQAKTHGGHFPFTLSYHRHLCVLLRSPGVHLDPVAESWQEDREHRDRDEHVRSSPGQEGLSNGTHRRQSTDARMVTGLSARRGRR